MDPNDHDLLIRLDTRMHSVEAVLRELKEDLIRRLKDVEDNKVSIRDFHDHVLVGEKAQIAMDKRLGDLEAMTKYVWLLVGALAAVEFGLRIWSSFN